MTGTVGVAAAVITSNWGALDQVITLESPNESSLRRNIGFGDGPDCIREIFAGGTSTVLAVRVGSGGDQAELELEDTDDTAAKVVQLLTKYPTSRVFTVSIRDVLEDETQRELLLHEDNRQLERILFDKGEAEPEQLVAAVNANSRYLTA
ncbi:hypothetical protein, partial [Proteus mirabilis]|uniref:hypothetical protein n=1 Tax=Proteus mirabilis TaxID=584 RepID=UPI001C7DA257